MDPAEIEVLSLLPGVRVSCLLNNDEMHAVCAQRLYHQMLLFYFPGFKLTTKNRFQNNP